MEGSAVGSAVGACVGCAVGSAVGASVGCAVGTGSSCEDTVKLCAGSFDLKCSVYLPSKSALCSSIDHVRSAVLLIDLK